MSIVGLLVMILVVCVLLWATRALLGAFGIGNPIATVIYVLVVLLALLYVLQQFGLIGGHIRVT